MDPSARPPEPILHAILKQSEFTVLPIPSGDTIRYYITVVSDPNNVVVEYHTDLSTGLGRFGV